MTKKVKKAHVVQYNNRYEGKILTFSRNLTLTSLNCLRYHTLSTIQHDHLHTIQHDHLHSVNNHTEMSSIYACIYQIGLHLSLNIEYRFLSCHPWNQIEQCFKVGTDGLVIETLK
jgi:hypothetical protein